MKKIILALAAVVLAAVLLWLFVPKQNEYNTSFYDVFDTYSTLTLYADNDSQAQNCAESVHNELVRLNKLYDIYNSYEGINNIKTINDNAGIKPVKIDSDLMELLEFAQQAHSETDGTVNPAMGSVLKIWHSYREQALENPQNASLPPMDELNSANWHTDISALVLDSESCTAYISDRRVSLDVGAIAKGFAADKAIKQLKENGIESALINLGGNVSAIGLNGRGEAWNVGIKNPSDNSASEVTVRARDASVVTSGDYQRYYEAEGIRCNHIIDGKTLMPAQRYSSVTVVAESSAVADMLSTALFILPEDEGNKLAAKYNSYVCRIYKDGTVAFNEQGIFSVKK